MAAPPVMLEEILVVLWWDIEPFRPTVNVIVEEKSTKTPAVTVVVSTNVERFTADSTVLEILRKLFVTLFMHDMRTVRWFDNLFTLETGG
jgi:hypothetical protein